VSVVQREGPVHLQQVVLRPEETPQVLWVEAHHQRNVFEATEGCKRILKYQLCPGVHFTDFQNLTEQNTSLINTFDFKLELKVLIASESLLS